MRIIAFPHRGISYIDSFYAAVKEQGGEVLTGEWSGRWLLNSLRKDDVVHIHWPSFLYGSTGCPLKALHCFFRYSALLSIIRLKHARIWWTAHNLLPHVRSTLPFLDVLGRHLIIALASRIFVHGVAAQGLLVARFPRARAKCVQIPFGNWIGHYQPLRTRMAARADLGIPPDAFVYLFFGHCKPYKNLEGLLRVFAQQALHTDLLLIAGSFSDQSYLDQISGLAKGDPRIRLDARFVPDSEVSRYLSASDVMCIPYREILTSGSAMLSISFGIPVISVDRGFLRDVITPETGILIEPGDDRDLAKALHDIRAQSWSSEKIVRHAQRFTFRDAARIFLNVGAGDEHCSRPR